MNTAFQGVGVAGARLIAVGTAHLLAPTPIPITTETITADRIEAELRRLDKALDSARCHLERVRRQIPADTAAPIDELISTHLLMLTDSALVDATRDLIRSQHINASWALQMQRDLLIEVFNEMEDPYLHARRDDVDHVVRQIQSFLTNETAQTVDSFAQIELSGKIVVAKDLTPAEIILLRQRGMDALVTEYGGPSSHTAILARSLDIPTVLGVYNATQYLIHGELLIVNADAGSVIATDDPLTIAVYRERHLALEAQREILRRLIREPSISRDGVPVVLLANLELSEDVRAAQENGASGVGLYRTEFLYLNHDHLPDEEEHLANYLAIIAGLDGLPLTIRTLDLGLDKHVKYIADTLPALTNPALGLRAIRLCLRHPELFVPQLRAILRASAAGPVRLMIPMISTLAEVETVLQMLHTARRSLRRDGLGFDPLMPIGAMIEVPAAALMAETLARRLDFLSIGTNDLIQYTLAIDRMDDSVSYLYEPLHPAILRLLRGIIEAAARSRTRVSMCGEMAGDVRYTRVLLGLGLRELSMQPGSLLAVKNVVRACDISYLKYTMETLFCDIDELPPQQLLDQLAAVDQPSYH
ncbi:phosphoenolpyruvate--protein phosphotransferase [Rhodoferax sp. 4810]|uniref:Phosphoenolpyruvate-protein phosphotransferase n=1 Tax=Thiospirillum jenense TaxID=1653858 RepID=A0A839H9V2_9GAMM|nr:phosphoenolpyruvate--protein phosphotransferase [Thiospirillum jenense]MBB1073825.1 phosphoenolpyruvate--protein phosphotransferase [Rhodoferax jenense]MBB1125220.1 phosphoenolpyruvate--protein phosphotransferase [Thiospirillum jenense]